MFFFFFRNVLRFLKLSFVRQCKFSFRNGNFGKLFLKLWSNFDDFHAAEHRLNTVRYSREFFEVCVKQIRRAEARLNHRAETRVIDVAVYLNAIAEEVFTSNLPAFSFFPCFLLSCIRKRIFRTEPPLRLLLMFSTFILKFIIKISEVCLFKLLRFKNSRNKSGNSSKNILYKYGDFPLLTAMLIVNSPIYLTNDTNEFSRIYLINNNNNIIQLIPNYK